MEKIQISRIRGDTYADKFLVATSGTPTNLTGCSIKMTLSTISNPVDITTQLYQLDGVVTEPESGIVEFSPSSTQANNIGYFYYDIQMVDSAGIVRTLVNGIYEYVQDITK